jgi:hypothetical protein
LCTYKQERKASDTHRRIGSHKCECHESISDYACVLKIFV